MTAYVIVRGGATFGYLGGSRATIKKTLPRVRFRDGDDAGVMEWLDSRTKLRPIRRIPRL